MTSMTAARLTTLIRWFTSPPRPRIYERDNEVNEMSVCRRRTDED
jgi:hypothetical protein